MHETSIRVIVRGGGDLASGIARRLYLCGLNVAVLELPFPRAIRRTVSYASAVHEGEISIEGVKGIRSNHLPMQRQNFIPVVVDETCGNIKSPYPQVIIDARMRKKPTEPVLLMDNCFVVGVGPDFEVGLNCHAVIETNRGHSLGRVLWKGRAQKNTRIPGTVCGYTNERILRAPINGIFEPLLEIGQQVSTKTVVAQVAGEAVTAEIGGVLRGVLYPGSPVTKGQKVGDIDPRSQYESCFTISDKSNAIAGGAMEAVMSWINDLHHSHGPHKETTKRIKNYEYKEKSRLPMQCRDTGI